MNFTQLLPWLIGGGLSATGSILGAKAQNKASNQAQEQSEWARRIAEQQLGQQQQDRQMLMPMLMGALGVKDPNMARRMMPQSQPLGASNQGTVTAVPKTGGSTIGKILGAGSGLAAMGGPAGMLAAGPLLGGKFIADQFGKGRRTANNFTGSVEDPFHEELKKLASGQGGLSDLERAHQNYTNQVNAWKSQGGNYAKVANQSLANQKLQDTINRLYEQLRGRG